MRMRSLQAKHKQTARGSARRRRQIAQQCFANDARTAKMLIERCSNKSRCHTSIKETGKPAPRGKRLQGDAVQSMHTHGCGNKTCGTDACRKQHDNDCTECWGAKVKVLEQLVKQQVR
jgi:hypothetical protein